MQDSVKVFYYCKKLHPICSGSEEEKLRLTVEVGHHGFRTNLLAATPWLDSLPYAFHAKQRSQLSLDHYIPIRPSGQPQIDHLSMTARTAFSASLIALH